MIKDFLMILKDHQMRFSGGIFDKRLINMRGPGEPVFEHDFPSGSDMIGSILRGPKAAKRMEFELFNRMATQFDSVE